MHQKNKTEKLSIMVYYYILSLIIRIAAHYKSKVLSYDQCVIFSTPNPLIAFSADPRATTTSTEFFSSKLIILPKASAPAIKALEMPLC